jgi:hypothetical protein
VASSSVEVLTCCPAACARAAVRLLIGASSARLSAPRPRRLVSAGGRELGGAGRAGAGPGEEEPERQVTESPSSGAGPGRPSFASSASARRRPSSLRSPSHLGPLHSRPWSAGRGTRCAAGQAKQRAAGAQAGLLGKP